MKLKSIPILLLLPALMLLVTGCGGDSQVLSGEEGPGTAPPSTSDHKTGQQSAILGETRYDIECIDIELGMDRSNEILDDKSEMTSDETDKVSHCTMASSESADARPETNEMDPARNMEEGLAATLPPTSKQQMLRLGIFNNFTVF